MSDLKKGGTFEYLTGLIIQNSKSTINSTTVTRDWAVFTDMQDGTVRVNVKAGTWGGKNYSSTTLYFAKCSHGMIYIAGINSCPGTATNVQFCDAAGDYCNDWNQNSPVIRGALFNACNGVNLGGRTSWRVPTNDELRLHINCDSTSELPSNGGSCSSFKSPTINSLFPNTLSNKYWSTSTYAQDTNNAWFINFSEGSINDSNKASLHYVRCITEP